MKGMIVQELLRYVCGNKLKSWFTKLVRNGIKSSNTKAMTAQSHRTPKFHFENLRFFGGAFIDKLVEL